MLSISPQIDSPLRDVLYRFSETGEQGGELYEFWFVFEGCCLHYASFGAFEYVPAPAADAQPIPRTADPMCIMNPHEQLFGAPLCGIYDDGEDEGGYILCLGNGHVIHLHTAYTYSDPTAGWYQTLDFYTPLRLSDIDFLDFADYISHARMQDARITVNGCPHPQP